MTNLGNCLVLTEELERFAAEERRKVAAICAAPSVLGQLGLLKGKRAICFPGWEEKLEGAQIEEGAKAVVDGNVITSRGMGTAVEFSLALVQELKDRETAEKLAASIQFV